jgi:hypothetical protein
MRNLFRFFAALDLLALGFLALQLWQIVLHFNEITLISDKVQSVLMFPLFILLIMGAFALLKFKTIGLRLYYVQFPLRLYLWVFSIGFITLIPEALGYFDDKWPSILLKACFVFEFIRLFLTIKADFQRRNFALAQ